MRTCSVLLSMKDVVDFALEGVSSPVSGDVLSSHALRLTERVSEVEVK